MISAAKAPPRARLAKDQETVFARFRGSLEPAGAEVLEIGGCLPETLIRDAGIRRWWSIDPRNQERTEASGVTRLRGSADSLPLPDGSVDLVFSCNAFQHVHPLEEVLEEAARVLRPGGHLYANFGPVWSGPDGAHIENLRWQGRRYDFWTSTLLPAWSHLVFDEDELRTFLTPLHGESLAEAVSAYTHRSSWINRRTFGDYRALFQSEPFDCLLFGGCADLDYPFSPPTIDHPLQRRLAPDRLAAEACSRWNCEAADLEFRDVEVLLRRH